MKCRRGRDWICPVLILAGTIVPASVMAAAAKVASSPAVGKQTIGYVVTDWRPAIWESSDGKAECPSGMQFSNRDNFEAQFPTRESRDEFNRQYVHLAPIASSGDLAFPDQHLSLRGPGGVNVFYSPTAVVDPLPLRMVQGKVAYGANLDGTTDGHLTPKSCRHEKFVGPDGEAGIDNQMYRLMGCSVSMRKGGAIIEYVPQDIKAESRNRVLIEISGLQGDQMDGDVVVTLYKGVDSIPFDSTDHPIPWSVQRIDSRYPQYVSRTRGRIVKGVLITEPVDQLMGLYQEGGERERQLRDMRLHLNLSETNAEGIASAYEDLALWWNSFSKSYGPSSNEAAKVSGPSIYAGAQRLADGYPDPQTGACTALSTAYTVKAVRALIVEPDRNDPLVIDADMQLAQGSVRSAGHPSPGNPAR